MSDQHLKTIGVLPPLLCFCVVVGNRARIQRNSHSSCFFRLETDPGEALQLFCGPRHFRVGIDPIPLNDFGPLALASVGHVEQDLIAAAGRARFDLKIAVLKYGVGESVSERKERLCSIMLVAAITYKNAFLIYNSVRADSWIIAVVNGIVFPAAFETRRQPPRWIYVAEQNFSQNCSALLPWVPCFKHRRNAIEPGITVHIPARSHDYNRVLVGAGDFPHEFVLPGRTAKRTARPFTCAPAADADS